MTAPNNPELTPMTAEDWADLGFEIALPGAGEAMRKRAELAETIACELVAAIRLHATGECPGVPFHVCVDRLAKQADWAEAELAKGGSQ